MSHSVEQHFIKQPVTKQSAPEHSAHSDPAERRQHQRYLAHFEARVTNLATGQSAVGNVVDFSQAGICVVGPMQLLTEDPANFKVQLEIADSVLIGHAVYSHPEGGYFRSGIAVEQVWLSGTEQGLNLQVVLLEAMPATPGVLAADAYLG